MPSNAVLHLVFLVVSIVLFILAAIPVASARANLLAIGLAFFAAAFLVS